MTTIDQTALDAFMGQFVTDFGAAMHAATVVIGDKLGLYKTLAEHGPITAKDLATRTRLDPRLVEEWCGAQGVSGYASLDPASGTWALSPEQAAVLADESTPAFLAGAMWLVAAMFKDEEKIRTAFETGRGLGWHEHDHDLFHGTERLFKPGYLGNLVAAWIPALDGVHERLQAGASIADLGCGHGASTILLAQAYPESTIVGFDYHAESIDVARKRAAEAGVADRVRFEVASAEDFPGTGYDLVCIFDALHDMGDPAAAASHIRAALAEDGTWLLVEPMTPVEGPVGRVFLSASVGICTPGAQAQAGAFALGNQVTDERWAELIAASGFTRFRRATETPLNRIFEVRR
ncbi:MAG: class I SAM-dependent methyltransferase [Actinobacteria bacterium]|nr:class I SAM-dependent methyltransferase [Actinomycetota bacterium]